MGAAAQLLLVVLSRLLIAASLRLEGPPAAPNLLASSPFKNVLLVVHCRLKERGLDPTVICNERKPLYESYRKFFADVVYITPNECKRSPGDPHACIADLIRGPGANRDGVFYMHFDSLMRPRHLGAKFDLKKMYTFGPTTRCEINRDTLAQEHCNCAFWSPQRAKDYQNAIQRLRDSGERAFAKLQPWEFWDANDDMFYLPKRVFDLYGKMAPLFKLVQHEVSGPTMRAVLQKLTRVPVLNLGCSGGCCKNLGPQVALQPDFVCGHAFQVQDNDTQKAFPRAISTLEDDGDAHSYMPLDTWKQVLEQALE